MNEREIHSRLKKLWGATGMPFGVVSRKEYSSKNQADVCEQWLHWIELGASGIVYGAHGVGKTMVLQKIREALSVKLYSVIVLTHTSLSAGDVLCSMSQTLGLDKSGRRSRTARSLLEAWQREGKKPILLVDEAQNLSIPALEELRLLMCASGQLCGSATRDPLTLSLCGDIDLLRKLQLGVNEPLLSRLGYHLQLSALDEEETESYIKARFEEVSVLTPPVDNAIIPLIHKACEGNPRKINQLLQQAIVCLLQSGHNKINAELLQVALPKVPSIPMRRQLNSS